MMELKARKRRTAQKTMERIMRALPLKSAELAYGPQLFAASDSVAVFATMPELDGEGEICILDLLELKRDGERGVSSRRSLSDSMQMQWNHEFNESDGLLFLVRSWRERERGEQGRAGRRKPTALSSYNVFVGHGLIMGLVWVWFGEHVLVRLWEKSNRKRTAQSIYNGRSHFFRFLNIYHEKYPCFHTPCLPFTRWLAPFLAICKCHCKSLNK